MIPSLPPYSQLHCKQIGWAQETKQVPGRHKNRTQSLNSITLDHWTDHCQSRESLHKNCFALALVREKSSPRFNVVIGEHEENIWWSKSQWLFPLLISSRAKLRHFRHCLELSAESKSRSLCKSNEKNKVFGLRREIFYRNSLFLADWDTKSSEINFVSL